MPRSLLAALALSVPAAGLGPAAAGADGHMLIQAGAFWMGSDDDGDDQRPMHRVFVRDFWLDRHKVTTREFAAFLDARGTRNPEGEDYFDGDDPDARLHRRDGQPDGAFAADDGFAELWQRLLGAPGAAGVR